MYKRDASVSSLEWPLELELEVERSCARGSTNRAEKQRRENGTDGLRRNKEEEKEGEKVKEGRGSGRPCGFWKHSIGT